MLFAQKTKPENISYQVISQCQDLKKLPGDNSPDKAKTLFEKIMNEEIVRPVLKKFDPELFSFAVDKNNFYFIIQPSEVETDVKKIVNYVKFRFAEKYNNYMDRTGAFWVGRSAYYKIDDSEF